MTLIPIHPCTHAPMHHSAPVDLHPIQLDNKIDLFQDVAMAFESAAGPTTLWFGRIQRILQRYRGKRKTTKLLLHAVTIDKMPDGLFVSARFYKPVRGKTRTYKYGSSGDVDIELQSYPVTSILHIVQFDYNNNTDEYTIDRDQYNIVMDKLHNLDRDNSTSSDSS